MTKEIDLMKCCAIIPARGGSKRIPQKNIYLLHGKPLIAYTIEQVQSCPSIDRVIVSTDDNKIATVAQKYGAEVIWRPLEISGDMATSESALLHTLDTLRETEEYEPDLVVFPQATSPIRQPDDIQHAIDLLLQENADSLFSACPLSGFVWRREEGKLISFNFDHRNRPRHQDAHEDLMENGSFFIFKPWVLRKFNNRIGGKITAYLMRVIDSFEVDSPDDLELIEYLLAARQARSKNVPIEKQKERS